MIANVGRVNERPTALGLAYSRYAPALIADEPGIFDYVEIPFEQLVGTPDAIDIQRHIPVVLHCASLSVAGNVAPDDTTLAQLTHWIETTRTPWLGEHLAYVRADGAWREGAEHPAIPPGIDCSVPFNVGYTVSPQLSEAILDRVIRATEHWHQRFGLPVLLENGPVYFSMPGSTMSQFAFIREFCARSPSAALLLDLAHLVATCQNVGADPFEALENLPLDRVVEVHVSGVREQSGVTWDDHVEPAPALVFDLLARLLERTRPRAVTLEYNWDARFPRDILKRDVARIRTLLDLTVPCA